MKNDIEFYGVVLNRKAFVSWMGGQELAKPSFLRKLTFGRDLNEECCALVWPQGSELGPDKQPLIVVPSGGMTEFFAFVGTYLPGYAPFSAFFRVISEEELGVIMKAAARPIQSSLAIESVGIAIAEAALRDGKTKTSVRTNLASVRSSLSSSLLASAYHGNQIESLRSVAENWRLARRILGADDTATSVATCLSVVSRYVEALDSESAGSALAKSLRFARASKGVTVESWHQLVSGFPELMPVFERLRGPREERLKTARSVLKGLFSSTDQLGGDDVDCIAGCVIALVGDGSFLYLPLAIELGRQSPGTILWFAAWSSLFATTDILTFGGASGRRTARDLFRPFEMSRKPECDIAIGELEASSGDTNAATVAALNPVAIVVEIFPGVNAVFENERSQGDNQRRRDDIDELIEVDRLLDRARESVARAIYRRERGEPNKSSDSDRFRKKR